MLHRVPPHVMVKVTENVSDREQKMSTNINRIKLIVVLTWKMLRVVRRVARTREGTWTKKYQDHGFPDIRERRYLSDCVAHITWPWSYKR